jgi:hypothetical protein
MGEQDRPSIADPVVEIDVAAGSVSDEQAREKYPGGWKALNASPSFDCCTL